MKVRDDVAEFMDRLGHRFSDLDLLTQALSHPSWTNEAGFDAEASNQRLEFLGDAVLELTVSRMLYEKFPEADEGRLTRARAFLVNEGSLSRLARDLGLSRMLLLGRGEAGDGGADKPSILADALEAVLGAVFIDGGLEAAETVAGRLFLGRLESAIDRAPAAEAKTRLQELVQRSRHITPQYRLVDESGPDHDKRFVVEVEVDGQVWGEGRGRSRKEAEQRAAVRALNSRDDAAGNGSD